MKIEKNEILNDALYLQDAMEKAKIFAEDAYEVLGNGNFDGEEQYILSLQFLQLSQQYYIEFKRLLHDKGLDHYELNPFIIEYDDFVFQLRNFVKDKDNNTSWLYTACNKLREKWSEANEFLTNFIKNNTNPQK
mgnify:CR=1 FL=1